jgi:hypothetical protein
MNTFGGFQLIQLIAELFPRPSPWPSGYPDKAVTAFLLTALFGLLWANAGSEAMVLAIGFGMIFFIASPSPR